MSQTNDKDQKQGGKPAEKDEPATSKNDCEPDRGGRPSPNKRYRDFPIPLDSELAGDNLIDPD